MAVTLAIAIGAALLAGLFGWLGARKPDPSSRSAENRVPSHR